MAITNLADVKSYLNITDTTKDTKIEMLIPLVESSYVTIRNAPFDIVDGTIIYPTGSNVTAIEMIGFKLAQDIANTKVTSETIGTYSVSFKDESTFQGFPSSIVGSIKKYARAV